MKPKAKAVSRVVGSDSDDDFVVKENKFQEDEKKNFAMENELRKRANQDEDEEDENHGALVKKILESKEQLEYGNEIGSKNKADLVEEIFFFFFVFWQNV